MRAIIASGLDDLGLTGRIPADAPDQLAEYGRLLLEKNQVMNLTAITEPDKVAQLHMLDCAALLPLLDFSGRSLIDIGTGAGFPGLPLKILCPALDVVLLDSMGKRVAWLNEVIARLGLTGVSAVHARAEDLGHSSACREQFDYAVSRAVAGLPVLSELCLPYVKVGGQFLAMKSLDSGAETEQAGRAIQLLGGQLRRAVDYTIPGTQVTHRLIPVRKERPTPERYPRRWAQIQKKPL